MRYLLPRGLCIFLVLGVLQCGDEVPKPVTDVAKPDVPTADTEVDAPDLEPPTNTAPMAVIDEPADGAVFSVDEPILFTGQVSDAEDAAETLNVAWSSNLAGAFGPIEANEQGVTSFETSTLVSGIHTVTLKVTDSAGESGSDVIEIEIAPRSVSELVIRPRSVFSARKKHSTTDKG